MKEIIFDNVGKRYGENVVIPQLNLKVEPGERLILLGPSGCGKSTTLRMIAGLEEISSGNLIMNERVVNDVAPGDRDVSMVFQNPDNQMVATTVEEEVAFGVENLQVPNPELRKRVDNAIELVGMSDFKTRNPSALSGGQKQRVSIAGVVAMMSDYIIFDEPTAMLDPKGRKDVIELVEKLNKKYGKTIIYITHYMEEAIIADKIIVLDKGKIALEGGAREVFSKVDQMKRLGLTVPQVTEVAYELGKKGVKFDKLPLSIDEFLESI